MKCKVLVSEELANYIESLSYTAASLKNLLVDAAERGLHDAPAFEHWEQKYIEADAELQIAKGLLEREYVIPNSGGVQVNWALDYTTRELAISEVS